LNPIGTATASLGEIAIFGVTGGAAMMQFNNGTFAAYIGIDADNSWKVGGYSMGANSYKLWHAGNDGAGSGLDADLLDGNQGAWYQQSLTDIVGFELGANLAGDRVSYFDMHADATNTDYSTRVLRNPGVNGVFAIDQKGTGGIAISSATGIISFTSSGSMGHNGNTIWTSGNDGAGSGLDADLLDGLNSNSAAGTGNTIAARDASGDLTVRTARVEFTSGGATGAYFLAMNAIGTTASGADNYSRPMTIAAAAAAMGAQVGTGSLGSYAMLRNDTAADVLPGGGIAGASTGYTNTLGDTSGSPGGSWRCMGYAKNNSNPVDRRCSIFVRFA
jgi:hypothetical protein